MLQLKATDGTMMIFASGSVVVNGFTQKRDLQKALVQLSDLLGLSPATPVIIRTITTSAKIPYRLDLSALYNELIHSSKPHGFKEIFYEFELFPKLTCKSAQITLNIFHTGSVIMMGGKNIVQFSTALSKFVKFVAINSSTVCLPD